MVNLGCGTRTHPSWINIDNSIFGALKTSWAGRQAIRLGLLSPMPANYINWDLRKGLPFPDGDVAVVYLSHVLEHIDRRHVMGFLHEVRRVLRPGGLFRVAVPDLERIVNNYTRALADCRADPSDVDAARRYDLAMLALFDQMVRTESGGELLKTMSKQPQPLPPVRAAILSRLKPWVAARLTPRDPGKLGELHRWMYDDYALTRLLRDAGFKQVRRTTYDKSALPAWTMFCLDNNADGTEYKAGSLYVEATKPA
jgi:predicted SAM-dependent methyltransferase